MSAAAPPAAVSPGRATFAAFCASLVGIGLARFSYTPLLPAVIHAGWFDASSATYLSAANLVGYLVGAILGRPMAMRLSAPHTLRLMMLLTALSLLACAWPVDFTWFFGWRLVSGVSGGALMVLAAPTVLPHVPPDRRGLASGLIFAGVGLGVAASGTLVPVLLRTSLQATWLGLAVLAGLLTVVAWNGWPEASFRRRPARSAEGVAEGRAATPTPSSRAATSAPFALRVVTAEYALNAIGLVPHMIFLVDYVARGLGKGIDVGATYWVAFGLGAMAGPVLIGHATDLLGPRLAMRLGLGVQAAAVALPMLGLNDHGLLLISSAIMGAFGPGIVPLMMGRIHELLPHDTAAHQPAWGRATTAFALLQAASAYAMSWVLSASGGRYEIIFAMALAGLLIALAADVVLLRKARATDVRRPTAPT